MMHRRRHRILLYGGTALVFLLLIAWILTRPQVLRLNLDTTEKPDYVFENPLFVENYNGVRTWQIQSTRGDLYQKGHQAILTTVSANILSEGNNYIVINAPRAVLDINTNDARFYICTINIPADRITILVDTLEWSSGTYLLKGTGNVKLLKDNIKITASRFECYVKERRFVIKDRPKLESTL